MNKEVNKKGLIGFNKFTIILILIYFLIGTGVTYAYFAFNYENDSVIVGNVVNVDATLTVERVVGTNEKLVPMMDDALSNALNAVGTTNGACIDSLGNLSCQVYKITLTNNASRLQHLVGTIELYSKDGSGNAYSNLKWQELSSTTMIKNGAITNGMNKSILVSDLTMESKESKTWYVGLWLSEIDSDQKDIDKGEFGGEVKFEVVNGFTEGTTGNFYNEFTEKIMQPNAQSDVNIDFSLTSEESNTNGIYLKNDTINDPYPIYYYRGNVDNNLIFADFCWKVVRTTETGGLKLLYNGITFDGKCKEYTITPYINSINFYDLTYMYGNWYELNIIKKKTEGYLFGNEFDYIDGKYVLIDSITVSDSIITSDELNKHHYTCFNTSGICESISYVYSLEGYNLYYITLNDGERIEDVLSKMLDYNTTSSSIKGNSTTEGTVDYWYYNNMDQKGYNKYIEDTVWCNDRSIYSLGGWNPNGSDSNGNFDLVFNNYNRAVLHTPSLYCSREMDRLTVSKQNGNGDLDYPVGLLTSDEIMLAGSVLGKTNRSIYFNSDFWSASLGSIINDEGHVFKLAVYNQLLNSSTDSRYYSSIIPAISLNRELNLEIGYGTEEEPYVIKTHSNKSIGETVTVNFNQNDGTSSNSSQNFIVGQNFGELPTLTREGYTFEGWSTLPNGGMIINENDIVPENCFLILYAQWIPLTYTITLEPNGGSVTPTSIVVTSGELYDLPIPSKSGYTFKGWWTENTGSSYVRNGDLITEVYTTLYALWDYNGGGNEPE